MLVHSVGRLAEESLVFLARIVPLFCFHHFSVEMFSFFNPLLNSEPFLPIQCLEISHFSQHRSLSLQRNTRLVERSELRVAARTALARLLHKVQYSKRLRQIVADSDRLFLVVI